MLIPHPTHARLRLALLILFASASPAQQPLTPAWVTLGGNGQAVARIVVAADSECPSIRLDGRAYAMARREPVPQGHSPVCEFPLPPNARRAVVLNQRLPLPDAKSARVIVLGDTGCRIKGAEVQACNDSNEWPFAAVAAAAAHERPSLVLHVGDYHYRESPCPAESRALCGGSPYGDNWDAWFEDFFKPAGPLLRAAPWVFVRGNHEDCQRVWRGWFYYLDPRSWRTVCEEFTPPYAVRAGSLTILVMDSASASPDSLVPEQAALLAAQLRSWQGGGWLAVHHPLWGLRQDVENDRTLQVSPTLRTAWELAGRPRFDLIVAGHIHLYQLFSFLDGRPPQLVAGNSGTALAPAVAAAPAGANQHGDPAVFGDSRRVFGYVVMNSARGAWSLQLRDPAGRSLSYCNVARGTANCR